MVRRRGLALLVNADGSAELMYQAGGKLESRTWNATSMVD
jgi:hypothetical protein